MTQQSILILQSDPISSQLEILSTDRRFDTTYVPDIQSVEAQIRDRSFDLFVADLCLSDGKGIQWLRRVQALQDNLPILILVDRGDIHHAALSVKLGVEGFLLRPLTVPRLLKSVEEILDRDRSVRDKMHLQLSEALDVAQFEAIKALAQAIEEKDHYTGGHCERMVAYAEVLAKELGFSEEEIKTMRYAALLHDVGKIGIPESILNKPGKLTDEEFGIMKSHPGRGAQIVSRIASLAPVAEMVYAHQERYDGKGYPAGLVGEEIPIEARIVAVLDAYDAMTTERPYRKPLPTETAVQELERHANTQFDPNIVEAFVGLLKKSS